MGNSDSKLVFKQGIFKLSEPVAISPDDTYWTGVKLSCRLTLCCTLVMSLTLISFGNYPNLQKTSLAFSPQSMSVEPATAPSRMSKHYSTLLYHGSLSSETLVLSPIPRPLRRRKLSTVSECSQGFSRFSTRQTISRHGKRNSFGKGENGNIKAEKVNGLKFCSMSLIQRRPRT